MRLAIFTLSLVFGLSAIGQTFAVRISTNTTLAQGDQVIWSGSAWVTYGKGTNGQVLTMSGTNVVWATPSGGGGGGSGTVTSVGASTTVSGLGFSGSPVTTSGTLSLTGTVAVASGGTGATDASGARSALSLVPGTDVQAYDADLAAVAALANSGIIVRTGAGTVAARTITGDSEAVVTNGDGVSGNPTLSIGSAIARDAEVAAGYQPLDADLTAMAAGTAVATAQTNAVSMGAPVLYAGSTNVPAEIALKAPLASPALTGDPTVPTATAGDNDTSAASTAFLAQRIPSIAYDATTWNGNTNAPTMDAVRDKIETMGGSGISDGGTTSSLTITNLTTQRINGVRYYNLANGDILSDGVMSQVGASSTFHPFAAAAISSGTIAADTGTANDRGRTLVTSAAGANSGYSFTTQSTLLLMGGGEFSDSVWYMFKTNNIVLRAGFMDVFSSTEPTDGVYLNFSGGVLEGVASSNSSRTRTVTTTPLSEDSTIIYRGQIDVDTAASIATFVLFTNGVQAWSGSTTGNVPTGSGRHTGGGIMGIHTGSGAGTNIAYISLIGIGSSRAMTR